MNYLEFTIEALAEWQEALTMVLYAHGAPGLQIDDPALIAAHLAAGDWDASVFDGQQIAVGRVTLRALFPENTPLEPLCADLAALTPEHARLFAISAAPLPAQDWQQLWRESFPALPLGQKLLVLPHWRQETPPPGRAPLYIAPGLAFGTGDHASTALAAELLESYLQPTSRVLDAGCGSGILAIAALKLGAAAALALDIDPVCGASLAEHRQLNGLSESELPFLLGDITQDAAVQAACRAFAPTLLLANIVAAVIAALAAPAAALLPAGGLLLASGILIEKAGLVEEALAAQGWRVLERRERGEWLALAAQNEGRHG